MNQDTTEYLDDSRRTKVNKCLEMLDHTTNCNNTSCPQQGCMKIKAILVHNKNCRRKLNGNCPFCKQLIALCLYHAKHCPRNHCKTPYCSVIKQRIRQKSMQTRLSKALRQPSTTSFLKLQQWNQPKQLIGTTEYPFDKVHETIDEAKTTDETIEDKKPFHGIFNSKNFSESQEIQNSLGYPRQQVIPDSFRNNDTSEELRNWPLQGIPKILPRPSTQYKHPESKTSFAPKATWDTVPAFTSMQPRVPYTKIAQGMSNSFSISRGINNDTIKDLSEVMGEDYFKLRAKILEKIQNNSEASVDRHAMYMDTAN